VLNACAKEKGIQRVVVTSSVAAVIFGHDHKADPRPLNEDDWNTVRKRQTLDLASR
jgi:nucleoside-diphosphate-sugar epimerase